jgi:hypothetical protein
MTKPAFDQKNEISFQEQLSEVVSIASAEAADLYAVAAIWKNVTKLTAKFPDIYPFIPPPPKNTGGATVSSIAKTRLEALEAKGNTINNACATAATGLTAIADKLSAKIWGVQLATTFTSVATFTASTSDLTAALDYPTRTTILSTLKNVISEFVATETADLTILCEDGISHGSKTDVETQWCRFALGVDTFASPKYSEHATKYTYSSDCSVWDSITGCPIKRTPIDLAGVPSYGKRILPYELVLKYILTPSTTTHPILFTEPTDNKPKINKPLSDAISSAIASLTKGHWS